MTPPATKLNRRAKDESEKAKELMTHTDEYQELVEDPDKESVEEPRNDEENDELQMNILHAQMSDTADKGRTKLVKAMDQHAPVLAPSTTVQDDDDCIKADGLSKETLEKVKHIYRRAKDGDEKAKEIMRQIQKIG
jgi:hypothetical protein